MITEHSLQRPLIIGHRGDSGMFPENSLPALLAGCYAGSDFVELDVQMTKD
jgi:glycerophosphoryl diester phosphodiesterase